MSWLIFAFLSAITAALVAIFGKMGLSNVDTTAATTVRSIVMMFALVLTSLFLGKLPQIADINSRDWWLIVLSGLAGAASWLFYFTALKLGPASRVAVIDRLSLVFVFILAFLFLGEKYSSKAIVGVLLVVFGAILTVLP